MSEFLDRLKQCVEREAQDRPGAKKLLVNRLDWQSLRAELKVDDINPLIPVISTVASIDIVIDDTIPEDCIVVQERRWY